MVTDMDTKQHREYPARLVMVSSDGGETFVLIAQALDEKGILVAEALVRTDPISDEPELSALPNAVLWPDFLGADDDPPLRFEPVPFDHPLYVMYSSGTTGLPKCLVQSHGGILLQHLKEHRLHVDLGPEDVLFYFTTCGWMMWNWLVTGLASGATLVLFDGNPFYPDPLALWRLADRERVTVFGTSAKYIAALEKAGAKPSEAGELAALRRPPIER